MPPGVLSGFSTFCQLLTNNHPNQEFELIAGLGEIDRFEAKTDDPFHELEVFAENHKDWLFGHLSYDLKNKLEALHSGHEDRIGFPLIHFFVPRFVVLLQNGQWSVGSLPGDEAAADAIGQALLRPGADETVPSSGCDIKARVNRDEYMANVEAIRKHIARGDIYEMNYCIEFFAENATIDPATVFTRLNEVSQAPFSAFYRLDERWLMCASPERFLRKQGRSVISQPIKGTAPRGKDAQEDNALRERLRNDPKERSENIMIVDLVRNDLSHTAARGSVKVDELCGIYTFRQVHQMISTVRAELKEGCSGFDVIRHAFPMGSMTGAPKVRAMQLIETFENTKRGLYSGAVGYFTPGGDFDLNVVIRSVQYNSASKSVSYMAGSAITHGSDPAKEYDECLLKAKAMSDVLR